MNKSGNYKKHKNNMPHKDNIKNILENKTKKNQKIKKSIKNKKSKIVKDTKGDVLSKKESFKDKIDEFKKKNKKEKANIIIKSSYFHIIILLILSSFIMFNNLGDSSLNNWDEGIHAQVSKEILNTGDWITPHWKENIYWGKPPLKLWLTALTYKLLGVSEFTAKIWSALFGIGAIIFTYLLGRKLFNKYIGFLSSLILLTCNQFIFHHCARTGEMDSALVFLIVSSIYFFLKRKENPINYYFFGIIIGLAFLTKSVTALLPIFIIGLYCVLTFDLSLLKEKNTYITVFLGMLVALPWFLVQYLKHGYEFINKFFFYHVVERAKEGIEGNVGGNYYYIEQIVNNFSPWYFFVLFAILYSIKHIIYDKKKEDLLLISWISVVFGIFTIAGTKLPWYIMPVYPALAILIAKLIYDYIKKEKEYYVKILAFVPLFLTLDSLELFSGYSLFLSILIISIITILPYLLKNNNLLKIVQISLVFIIFLGSLNTTIAETSDVHMRTAKEITTFISELPEDSYVIYENYNLKALLPADYFYLSNLNATKLSIDEFKSINTTKTIFYLTDKDVIREEIKELIKNQSLCFFVINEEYKHRNKKEPLFIVRNLDTKNNSNIFNCISSHLDDLIDNPTRIDFNNQIEFLGYSINETLYLNEYNTRMFKITYYWKSLKPVNESYKVFVHFVNESGNIAFQNDHMPFYGLYNTSEWKVGEIIKETYNVYIWDNNVKPNTYFIKVGLYNEKGRLKIISNQDYRVLNQTPIIQYPKSIIYNNTFEFLGYDLNKTQIEQEEKFKITYYWEPLNKTNKDYILFVHFLNESGKIAFQNDHKPPVPTSNWTVGQILKETKTVNVPKDVDLGNYNLFLGFYIPSEGRVPITKYKTKIDKTLNNILVTNPNITYKTFGNYNNKIALLGYNIDKNTIEKSDSFRITYFWKSLDHVDINYTIFVHFIDEKNKIRFQQDHRPAYGIYPTSAWNAGNIIKEEYDVMLPTDVAEGTYRIKIGLYNKETNKRIYLTDRSDSQIIGNITVEKSEDYIFEIIKKTEVSKPKVTLDDPGIVGTIEVK